MMIFACPQCKEEFDDAKDFMKHWDKRVCRKGSKQPFRHGVKHE